MMIMMMMVIVVALLKTYIVETLFLCIIGVCMYC